jgi:putative DNA primase/helicase
MNSDEIERARSALAYIEPYDHDTWVKVGMALKSEFRDDGWTLFDEWSRSAENYNERENRFRWRSFKPGGGITIATPYRLARDAGWQDDGTRRVPDPEELAHRRRERAEADAKAKASRDAAVAEAARKARAIWSMAVPATAATPYCRIKGIVPCDTLREIEVEKAATVLLDSPSAKGELLQGTCLVTPIKVGDKLSSLQLIDHARRKHFLKDGRIGGGYWAAQSLPEGDGSGLVVLIGEGVATVLSALAAMPSAVGVSAMSNGNISAVAGQLRKRYPRADLVILADLDKTTGEPDAHARKAAQEVGGRLARPEFTGGSASDRKDINDLARLEGHETVRRVIEAAEIVAADPADERADPTNSRGSATWPSPQPLVSKIETEPYPVDALPPAIRAAVEEVASYMQAPLPLVASCSLVALSAAGQHIIDVRRDARLCGPVALFFLMIADSGERKTTLDTMFNAPLRDWQRSRFMEMKPQVDAYKSAHAAWLAENEGVRTAIKDAAKRGSTTDELKRRLARLTESEPRAPRVPHLFVADETAENLAWRLHSQWPAAALISSEAGVVLGGYAMGADKVLGYLALLNILWDGGEFSVGRKTSETFTLRGSRLTCGLQIQEAALLDFISREGPLARGTGFWARFLICWPPSTIGNRPYREPGEMPGLNAYHARLARLLDLKVPLQDDGTLKPAVAHLSAEAKAAFIEFYNAIERELGDGGELHDVRDVASKAAENAARLAALFEVLASDSQVDGLLVTADSFNSAGRIVAWHLSESRRFFGELAMPQDFADAARLDAWLIERCRREHATAIQKNHVRQFGPGRLRDAKRLDGALKSLTNLDRLRIRSERPVMIEVNPALIKEVAP